jgi:hypothetical protein
MLRNTIWVRNEERRGRMPRKEKDKRKRKSWVKSDCVPLALNQGSGYLKIMIQIAFIVKPTRVRKKIEFTNVGKLPWKSCPGLLEVVIFAQRSALRAIICHHTVKIASRNDLICRGNGGGGRGMASTLAIFGALAEDTVKILDFLPILLSRHNVSAIVFGLTPSTHSTFSFK